MANAFAVAAEKARKANEERYTQGMSLWDEIIQRYQPGGAFGAGAMASYERGKTKAVGAGMQQLVSAGLANTTVAATIGKKYEEEVGTPFRTQLEDMRMGRLSQAQEGKVGFIERREDVAPDPNVAMQSGYQAGYGRGGGGGGGGDNFTMPGFNEDWMSSSSPFGGGGGSRGGASSSSGTATNPGGTRAGTPEYQRTLDIGRITFAGEESRTGEFSPTGTGGEAKTGISSTLEALYGQYKKQKLASGGRALPLGTLMKNPSNDPMWASYLTKSMGVAPTSSKTSVGTTSYAAKGGGFGGRGF